ncbi:chloramphenicol phosphotransferase [Pullulanibacillus sp. KACC 23026]|uniref:chloramphenicol phosphotransferase CPT family protein n=1 Tax=Pullulanibacillus sp. KACC 23026 TaxID=3028315 RepID=UPI0023B1ADF5|nr:chloramphenicol phosphotransferase [Pullulanibacillus sp. KACC 23026]WEG13270.1 chloramphenicol phosphotransferase [Pullulanibacillus sp. KACC 23026]
MLNLNHLGQIVILNGAPRSGKSSLASIIQESFDGVWMNLGVDAFMKMTPDRYQPGIGLRPGGERPDLEPIIEILYQAMYESIAAHSRLGLNVVVDVGHHDCYSTSRGILGHCAQVLKDFPVLFVGIRCPLEMIMERRLATWKAGYTEEGTVPHPVKLWQESVHVPGIYDLELDTSVLSPKEGAALIRERLEKDPYGTAFKQIAENDESR